MKNTKKRSLRSTLLLLLMIAILLIVSTYAWFTSNRTVTVDTIEVNVAAVNGLQISTNASDWKTIINNGDIRTGYTNHKNYIPDEDEPEPLKPVSSALSTDSNTGMMDMYYGVVEADSEGIYKLSTSKEVDQTSTNYIVFDMFLKVDEDSPVYMTPNSLVTAKDSTSAAKGLQNATRVVFVYEGHVDTGGTAAQATALKGASRVIVWEPNSTSHTAASITHAQETYGVTLASNATVNPYVACDDVVSDITLGESNDATTNGFSSVTDGSNVRFIRTGTTTPGSTLFDNLVAGVTKYRVYIYIEGQDYDCQNAASGSDLKFDMQFSLDVQS